ncbi:hypothetical protein EFK50_04265 [Nocardioides marmoriginsengisoli]|uniref:Uncharacterized protein n=1 Tax=Nocardioides marmoriginsengisoli TaxID=661483 RepID=A0A3N0CQ89_9ACTN|nr:hypothetical protein EFK50_04265 [Nocardioides marmoriginsengisoli]
MRTSRIETPVRRCSPVIRPSRGPGPNCEPMYSAVATPLSRTPASSITIRTTYESGVLSRLSATSAERPTRNAFAIVPRPGSSLIGIQRSSTTRLITITASPIESGRCFAMPWCRTSHGAFPIAARRIIARVKP